MDFVSDFVRAQDSEPYHKMVSTVYVNTLILMFFQVEDFQIFFGEFKASQAYPNRVFMSLSVLVRPPRYWKSSTFSISVPIDVTSGVMSLELMNMYLVLVGFKKRLTAWQADSTQYKRSWAVDSFLY